MSDHPAPTSWGGGYASWWQRVAASLVDALVLLPAYAVVVVGLVIGRAVSDGLGLLVMGLGSLLMLGIAIWNQYVRQGRTGWSLGKQAVGVRLLREDTGRPVGAGLCFVRSVVHVLDALPCYLGFLWPLWDAKRQTFADKVMTTAVVQQPRR